MIIRNYTVTGIALAIVLVCIPVLADQFPGSTQVVNDPYNFSFDEAGNGSAYLIPSGPTDALSVLTPESYLTYQLPVLVTAGDLAILPANSLLVSGLTPAGNGVYTIPQNSYPASDFLGGLGFETDASNTKLSDMQFYFGGNFPVDFSGLGASGGDFYAILAASNGSSFYYNSSSSQGGTDNTYAGVFGVIPVPEPCGNVGLLGLLCTGLLGVVWGWRKQAAAPVIRD